ncbi:MAG: DUF188 domain-containing protein [Treponema sp.]|nr:DUF188 domain-containing protein [Treponema sp.]MCL2251330.1 DUF188 domain-containing protein [Treponema sp.]
MKILVDADSCPRPARELILRRALKMGIRIIFAANRQIPDSDGAEMIICPVTDNSADDRIAELAEKGDLALTRDVPLAKRLVDKEVIVIDDRGRAFTSENINELLSLRNFAVGLADNGLETERTANYSKKELKTFADALDRILTKITMNLK